MRIRSFRNSESGGFAAMAGLSFGLIFLASGAAIDLTATMEADSEAQRLADRASLAAARAYRDAGDKAAAEARGTSIFQNGLRAMDLASFTASVSVTENPDTGEITALATSDLSVDTLFMGVFGDRFASLKVESESRVSEEPQDLYLVLLIDSTGSMMPLIDSVKNAALQLEDEVRTSLTSRGITIDRLFVKAAFFGDLRLDAAPNGWIESPIYNLGDDTQATAFRDFVAARITYEGYDLPESGPAAIAHFLTAPLPSELDASKTIQATVLWTDAPGLPLSSTSVDDDITVNLYTAHGPQGTSSIYDGNGFSVVTDTYSESAYYDGDAIGGEGDSAPSYGCCSSLSVLETVWRNHGTVPPAGRMLGLIVPTLEQPWNEMANWPGVFSKDYTTPTASGILDDVLDSLGSRYSPLVVSK